MRRLSPIPEQTGRRRFRPGPRRRTTRVSIAQGPQSVRTTAVRRKSSGDAHSSAMLHAVQWAKDLLSVRTAGRIMLRAPRQAAAYSGLPSFLSSPSRCLRSRGSLVLTAGKAVNTISAPDARSLFDRATAANIAGTSIRGLVIPNC